MAEKSEKQPDQTSEVFCVRLPLFYPPENINPLPSKQPSNAGKRPPAGAEIPVRAYLDQTVVPILIRALSELAKVRPDNPVEFVARYLLDNDPSKVKKEE